MGALLRWHVMVVALLLVFAARTHAQTTTGVIDGVIRDPDGSPVPGVQITANSPSLIQRDLSVSSNQDGYYRLTALPPGTYAVTYLLQGFQTIERAGLLVNAGQTTAVDIQVALAGVAETVTVVGDSPTIDPTSATLGFNYTQQLLDNVPTSRNFHNMVTTIPGVETASVFGTSPGNLENESVLGAGPYGNRYNLDGGNITDPTISVNQANLFSADIIQEMQVLRGAKPAEVGFSQGGFFNIVTKSGGNQFHGDGDLYYQGKSLQSENLNDLLRGAGVTRSNELVDDLDASLSAGGRVVRDKLWWFGSARRQDRTFQVLGFAEDVTDEINAYFWKNTFQPHPQHRFTGLYNHWDETVNFFFFGFAPALAAGPEVSMLRKPGGDAFQTRWEGVLGENVIADAGFGWNELRLDQIFHETSGVSTIDLVTGRRFGSPGAGGRDSTGTNYTSNGSLSWFVPEALGRHDLKFGGEYTHSPFAWGFTEIRDHTLAVQNGSPFRVTILNTPVDAAWVQNFASVFGQDAWTVKDRLTLNLGIRYDHVQSMTPEQSSGGGTFATTYLADQYPQLRPTTYAAQDLWSWHSVAPRVAAAYKLDSGGRTVLKAGFARYFHHLNSQQVWTVNRNFPFNINLRWSDLNSDGAFQLGEEGQLLSLTGGGLTTFDPDVRHPYSDEATVGVSRELFTDFSVNANFIYRTDNDLINTIDIGVPFDTYRPVPVNDPGDDGRAGTTDDRSLTVFAQDPSTFGGNRSLLTNPGRQGFDDMRTYRGFELIANKRFSNGWQFVGSLVASEMDVVVPTSDSGGAIGTTFSNPNSQVNVRGKDSLNQTYQVKLQGTYMAPFGILLSSLYRYGSGFPFTRQLVVTGLPQGPVTVNAEPRGARETDSYHLVDARVEKTFTLGQARRLGLILDAFNLTNASTVLQYGSRTGVDLGTPRLVRNPRIARLGVRFTW